MIKIFDLDGTIIDSNGIWLSVDQVFLQRRELTHTQEYQRVVERSIYPIAAQFTKEYYRLSESPEEIMAEWDSLAEHFYREKVELKPGVREFIEQEIKIHDQTLAIFTACRPALCEAVLERFELRPKFSRVVYAEEIGLEKRDPQCFVTLSERLDVKPECCTFFDDSPDNCATAAKAGMAVVGVYDPYYADRQDEMKAVCSQYIHSFEELLTEKRDKTLFAHSPGRS